MATDSNKENIADGLLPAAPKMASLSPRKPKKSRSLSMGPGARASAPLKEDAGNRRKSMMPAIKKTILAVGGSTPAEEESKRRAERRKSMLKRRVSFAPEATLHTWDVIEYRGEATSSSASSDDARRLSSVTQASGFKTPEPDTPAAHRQNHDAGTSDEVSNKSKRRKSSSTPAANIPAEHSGSSSPMTLDSPARSDLVDGDDDEYGDATMDLDEDQTMHSSSGDSVDTTSSSERLDARLREATEHMNTQQLDFDSNGDKTMEICDDEVTYAFKSWNKPSQSEQPEIYEDQENVDPFSQQPSEHLGDLTEEISMDLTRAIGGLRSNCDPKSSESTKTLKRRWSSINLGAMADSQGSPIARPSTRRSSKRHSSMDQSDAGDDSIAMDFTEAIGGIREISGTAMDARALQEIDESVYGDATMEFTVAIGGIRQSTSAPSPPTMNTEMLEDLSMELTENLGKVHDSLAPSTPSPLRRRSPRKSEGPSCLPPTVTIERPSPRSPKSPSTPKPQSPQKLKRTPTKSPRRSPRKSFAPSPLSQPPMTPEQFDHLVAVDPQLEKVLETPVEIAPAATKATEFIPSVAVEPGPAEAPDASQVSKPSLSDTLRLLLTPRKEILPTTALAPPPPQPTPKYPSPKKQPSPRKQATPKRSLDSGRRSVSPRKRVRLDVEKSPEKPADDDSQLSEDQQVDPISLSEFLNMTNIRFMDLTTTKRRATGHPGAEGMIKLVTDEETDDQENNLENNVAAAVGILPMLMMLQHSCHEMKSYISSGRSEIKALEAEAKASQPPLFHDYKNASASERAIMDTQLADLKANARYQSKAGWHNWRGQVLNDLKTELLKTQVDLQADDQTLSQIETVFRDVLPSLEAHQQDLLLQLSRLEQRKQDQEDNSASELADARENLIETDSQLKKKRELLKKLQTDAAEQNARIDDARSWKSETIAAISEADRVSEECRGWSTSEVLELHAKVQAAEQKLGWGLVSASDGSITLKHETLHITFHPRAWISQSHQPPPDSPNAPVFLSFVDDDDINSSKPDSTVRRFFVQLLRSYAHALPQCQTHAGHLLSLIRSGWSLCGRVLNALRALEPSGITNVCILGDEKIGISTNMLLTSLQTKVLVRFAISANQLEQAVVGNVDVSASVVYGEKYDEPKMGDFLRQFISGGVLNSSDDVRKWAAGLEDLRGRLLSRGKKGTRIA